MANYSSSRHLLLETNIDDMSPELVPHVFDLLFEAGARDVWSTPIIMKGGRPAFCLSVLFDAEIEESICELVFRETSTLGVRVQELVRHELAREIRAVKTHLGVVNVKLALGSDGKILNAAPEYADCRRLAVENTVPIKEIYRLALDALV
jgi:uncharacterized protein (DUF111 family)